MSWTIYDEHAKKLVEEQSDYAMDKEDLEDLYAGRRERLKKKFREEVKAWKKKTDYNALQSRIMLVTKESIKSRKKGPPPNASLKQTYRRPRRP